MRTNAERLYRELWLNKPFENDFKFAWREVSEMMKRNEPIPRQVLKLCINFLDNWEEKKGTPNA